MTNQWINLFNHFRWAQQTTFYLLPVGPLPWFPARVTTLVKRVLYITLANQQSLHHLSRILFGACPVSPAGHFRTLHHWHIPSGRGKGSRVSSISFSFPCTSSQTKRFETQQRYQSTVNYRDKLWCKVGFYLMANGRSIAEENFQRSYGKGQTLLHSWASICVATDVDFVGCFLSKSSQIADFWLINRPC